MMHSYIITHMSNWGAAVQPYQREGRQGAGVVLAAMPPRSPKGGLRHKGKSPVLSEGCGGDLRG